MAKKGFGQSEPPIRNAKKFISAFEKKLTETKGNPTQIQSFFKSNIKFLDEDLLEALPLVFSALTANQLPEDREQIASLFVAFGNSIANFSLGSRMLNLELSITAYQLALKVVTREAFPKNWAGTQNNLGAVYGDRIRGDRAENLEQAIAAFQFALQVRTREAFPQDWARSQNNLGAAYINRIRGDRAENLEQAIAALHLALQIYTREDFPEDWAKTQHNLANAYRDRIRGNQAENLERSIETYRKAAEVFTCEAYPDQWAGNQGHLAEALMKRAALTDKASDLHTAIDLLQGSLEVAVPGSPDFIDCQYRLGNALSRRYEHSQNTADLEQATQAYQTALDAISPEHYDRKQIWQALPATQSILGSLLVREGRWQEGLQLLLNSVRQLSTGSDPLAHADALFQTGRAHEALTDWENARLYYRDALRLYDHLNNQKGMAQSNAALGSVLISQGFLEKGMAALAKARQSYEQLQQTTKIAEVENLYQIAQKAIERQTAEVYA